jgi:hypothetical protein
MAYARKRDMNHVSLRALSPLSAAQSDTLPPANRRMFEGSLQHPPLRSDWGSYRRCASAIMARMLATGVPAWALWQEQQI